MKVRSYYEHIVTLAYSSAVASKLHVDTVTSISSWALISRYKSSTGAMRGDVILRISSVS